MKTKLTLQQQRSLVYKTLTELQTNTSGVSITPFFKHKLRLRSSNPLILASIDLETEFIAKVSGDNWSNQFEGEVHLYRFIDLITNLIK